MSMSRVDFELVAAVIRHRWVVAARLPDAVEAGSGLRQIETLAHELAASFGVAYPRFDRGRFLAAALPSMYPGATECRANHDRLSA